MSECRNNIEFANPETYKFEHLPSLCIVGRDGSVKWTEHASPEAIMKMWGDEKISILALWYATGGKDTSVK